MAQPVPDPSNDPVAGGSLRCSAVTHAEAVDPIGTAGAYTGYLLVEWPLPWPRDIGEVAELAGLTAALAGTGIRLQGLVPQGAPEMRRAILYRLPEDGAFAGYERVERVAPAAQIVDQAIGLVSGDGSAPAHGDVTDDVLVCTHGQRDVCCGSMGTALAVDLLAHQDSFGGGVRLWRTSHTGGHRFAPTAVVLPQGTVWAHLDGDAVRRIVARRGPLDDLMPRYRGCTGVGPPMVQALEREAFEEIGWDWLDHRRSGRVLDDGRVRLDAVAPDGTASTWEATVEVARTLPVPECGRPIGEAKKSETEWRVGTVRRT